jgi:hypothetical protein
MDRILDLRIDEERRIREVVARRPLPAFFTGFDVEFSEDWSGDPSVIVWLNVDVRKTTSAADLDEVNRYVRETEHELVALRLSHWPFVRFGSGRRISCSPPARD